MGINKGEKVLILTDQPRLDLAETLREQAKKLGAETEIILLPHPEVRKKQPLNTPSKILIGAIKSADVVLTFFENIPLELRPFRVTIIEKGRKTGRVGHMIGVERSSFEEGGLLADCSEVAKYSDLLAMILSKGKRLNIKSGPKLEYELNFGDIGGWYEIGSSDSGILTKKGSFGNLPAGEAFMAISLSRSAHIDGKICIDRFIDQVGFVDIMDPVILTIVKGQITKIEGGKSARKLRENLRKAEAKAKEKGWEPEYVNKISEIGIGTNPKAIIGPATIETEKEKGTLHIALGNNTTFGGTYRAPNHFDCVIKQAKLEVDSNTILEGGQLEDLGTLYAKFEEKYSLIKEEKIHGDSIIIKFPSEAAIHERKLFKIWKDFEGRHHRTQVGDNATARKEAELWKLMKNYKTIAYLLNKTNIPDSTVYQLLRLLEEYLLVSIQEKTILDILFDIRTRQEKNFEKLRNDIGNVFADLSDTSEQDEIYLKDILEKIGLIKRYMSDTNIEAILESLRRIESHTDELIRSGSKILSSKVSVTAGVAGFLGISTEVDLRKLLIRIKEKLIDEFKDFKKRFGN